MSQPSCKECGCRCKACDQGSIHLHVEIENLKQRLVERDRHIVTMETNFLSEADKFPDGEFAALTEELLTWQEKYSRLYESYKRVQKVNQGLEDKLLRVVDKCESEKGALTRDVASLTQRLVDARFDVNRLQEESERYRNDLNLAIQLLQCKPANFIPQKYEQLPADLQQKVRTYVSTKRKSIEGNVTHQKIERRTIKVPIPTFPPTAMVYSVNKTPNDKDLSDEEKDIGGDGHPPVDLVSAAILAKILEERERERLTVRHCDTCSCPSRKSLVDAFTQTNSVPHNASCVHKRNDSPSPVRMNLRYSSSLLGSGEASQVLVSLADDPDPPAPVAVPGILDQASTRIPLIPAQVGPPHKSQSCSSGWDDWGHTPFDSTKSVDVKTPQYPVANNGLGKSNGLGMALPRLAGNNRVESSVMVGPMAGAAGSRSQPDVMDTKTKPLDSVIIRLDSPPTKESHNMDVSLTNNNIRTSRRPYSSGTTPSDTSDSTSRLSIDSISINSIERRTSTASLRSVPSEKSPQNERIPLKAEVPTKEVPTKEPRPPGPIPCSLRFQAGTNNILLDNTHSFAPVLYTSRQSGSPQSSQNSFNSLSSNHSSHVSSRSNNASYSNNALSRSGSVSSTDDGWPPNVNESPSTSENSDGFNSIPTSQNNQRPHRVTINRTETGV